MSAPANEELLDFIAQGLKIFGPSTRVRIETRGHIGTFNAAADPAWSPPPKRFRDTRNSARSHKRGKKHGKS